MTFPTTPDPAWRENPGGRADPSRVPVVASVEPAAYNTPGPRDGLHRRPLARDRPDLDGHPASPLRAWAHRRHAATRGLLLLRRAGRAVLAGVRPGAVHRRRAGARGRLDRDVQRACRRRAEGRARAARILLQGVRPYARRGGGDAAGPDEPGLHELSARRRVRRSVSRGGGRAVTVLLDLLGSRPAPRAQRLRRRPLPAVDRHVCVGGVRRGGPRGDRGDEPHRGARGRHRAGGDAPALRHHQPLRVDVLGHGRAPGGLAAVSAVFFDLDDTLLDYSSRAETCWAECCATVAAPEGVDAAALVVALEEARRWFWSDAERHRRERTDMI